MKLSGKQVETLQIALLAAFGQIELRQMVRIELDENLDQIASSTNLSDTVFELIGWAEKQGKVSELITGAARQNLGNRKLHAWIEVNSPELADSGLEDTKRTSDDTEESDDTVKPNSPARPFKWTVIVICLLGVIVLSFILSQLSNPNSEPDGQDAPILAPATPNQTSVVTNPINQDSPTLTPASTNTVACPNSSCGQSRLRNGDFEQSLEFWGSIENAEIVSGRTGQGVQVNYDGKNSDIYQTLPGTFEQGRWYWAEAWCKADIDERCRIFLGDANFEFGPDYQNSNFAGIDGNGKWQQFGVSLYLNQEEKLNVYVYSQRLGRSVIYDDIRVDEIFCNTDDICNGDFEQGLKFWADTANAEIVPGRTGQGIQVSYDEASADVIQTLHGVYEGGKTYRAEVWCKTDVGETCALFLGDTNSKFGPPDENQVTTTVQGNGAWQKLSVSLPLTKREELQLYLYSKEENSSAVYDDILIIEEDSCGQNRLCNGGFEKGAVNWNFGRGSQIVSPGYESVSALTSIQKRSASDGAVWEGITQDIAVNPSLTYMVGGYIDAGNATEPHIKVLWFSSEEKLLHVDKVIGEISRGGTWSRWEKWFKAPPSVTLARVVVWHGVASEKNATGSTLRVDDLVFQPANTLCPTDRLCNSSFEMGSIFGWNASGSIDSDAYHGQVSLKSIQTRSVDNSSSWAGASQDIEVSANQDYDVNVWLKWNAASSVHAKVVWYDEAGDVILPANSIYTAKLERSDGWIQRGKTFRSPANAVLARISILHGVKDGQNDTGSTLWIDNVAFTPTE